MLRRKRARTLETTKASKDEKQLEALVFGTQQQALAELLGTAEEEERVAVYEEEAQTGFVVDTKGDNAFRETGASEDEGDEEEDEGVEVTQTLERKAAWVDEDEEEEFVDLTKVNRLKKLRKTEEEDLVSGTEYTERLRGQFERIHSSHKWAALGKKRKYSEGEDDEEILQRTQSLLAQSAKLPPTSLSVARVKDVNLKGAYAAAVQCVQFHPTSSITLSGGLDKTLRLHAVDGKTNPQIQSIFIPDLPIHTAKFAKGGAEAIIAGRRKFFYVYDVEGGNVSKVHGIQGHREKSLEKFFVSPDEKHIVFTGVDGHLIVVSARTKQWVCDLKMNNTARTVTFNADGSRMYTAGGDGLVYVWDMNARECVHRFVDEGCINSTSMAWAPNDTYLATGSDSGVVNIYNSSSLLGNANPKPLKGIMNLTTSADLLEFNHDAQILAMASKRKKDALKLVHLPSCTVFANWPTADTPLGYVHCFDFSPNSGYFAAGNDKGKVLLYRLNHYKQA
eukprot:Colp12_sorted_trinity150504_noHs@11706